MGILADWQIQRDLKIEPFALGVKRKGVVSYGLTSYGYDVRIGYRFRVLKPYPAGYVMDPKNFDENLMFETVDLTPRLCIYEQPLHSDTGHTTYRCIRCGIAVTGTVSGPSPRTPCARDPKPNYIDMPPYSFMLGESVERFTIPRDILVVNVGKSTYARSGLIVNVTPGEPEWNGIWTLELTNPTPRALRVYAGEGIMQSMFFRGDGRYELALGATADIFRSVLTPGRVPNGEEVTDFINLLQRLALRELPTITDPSGIPIDAPLEGTCAVSYADKKGKYQDQPGLTAPTVDGKELPMNQITPDNSIQPCQPDRGAAVEVECPRCRCVVKLPADRVESYTDRTCPVCKADMPFLPGRRATFVTNPGTNPPPPKPVKEPRPPADHPHDKGWASPDGSTWHWSDQRNDWVQVSEPTRKT